MRIWSEYTLKFKQNYADISCKIACKVYHTDLEINKYFVSVKYVSVTVPKKNSKLFPSE